MASSSETNFQTFSSADRIRQLNEIDKDVAKLVHSAGLAIQALTNAKSEAGNTVEARKAAFKAATAQYFALLSSIDVRLRRQVYALEEAGILAPDSSAPSRAGDAAAAAAGGGAAAAFNPLEISWLNSRKDTVGKDKEAELWAAAREFVTKVRAQSSSSSDTEEKRSNGESGDKANNNKNEEMEVD
ncbi:hypothetical protein VTN77DRAFT_4111 [Rasamsonia byssochlamydoides]|uniref:uncharacterized protein n=1 Tax=Rasamsonia byssochlamydoides TaxID=89139 RepID=UPI003743B329